MATLNKLADSVDKLWTIREQRLALQKQVDELKATETSLRESIIADLAKSEALGVVGKLRRATLVKKQVPQLKDFDALIAHCRRRNEWDLIQRRISDSAVKERWDAGKDVPGVEAFIVVDLSLTKV